MSRLQSELDRLYLTGVSATAEADAPSTRLIDPQGRVRAFVMELAQPASWEVLSRVWHGVQIELELPAPAIAVSGIDGLQLWFSLAEPVAASQAHAFVDALRSRFLPDIRSTRLRLMPAPDASAAQRHAPLVPARQELDDHWSAFVAPDLAAVFAEAPWLDVEPGEEGQAALLRGLQTMKLTSFEATLKRLAADTVRSDATATVSAGINVADPKRFLIHIMNDETAPLALRIEAAKALLPYAEPPLPHGKTGS
jgi:hypothetical protein